MLGISVYLGDDLTEERKRYVKQMREKGFTKIFTSLHIPEEDAAQYIERLSALGAFANELEMEVLADSSKGALEKINIDIQSAQSMKQLKEIGIAGLRVDYGFTNTEIAFLSQHSKVALNASTITKEDVEELTQHKAQFSRMVAMHNYYPRPETGLDKRQFKQKNYWLKQIGFSIAAFVPGDKELRGPLYRSLPTLEDHRNTHPLAGAVELTKECYVDEVYIGDPEITTATIEQFSHYFNHNTLVFYMDPYNRSAYFENVLGEHQNRWDAAKDVLRSADARFKEINEISPEHTDHRVRGAVTIDNKGYQRYMGEIQVIVHDLPADPKVNVAAHIRKKDLPLLDWCDAGCYFELRENKEIKENE